MFNFFGSRKKASFIDDAVQETAQNISTHIVDVRSPEEYRSGHVPGALNLPLENLQNAPAVLKDKNSKLYLYCLSGARSAMAAGMLRRMGYENCINAGGLGSFTGKLER